MDTGEFWSPPFIEITTQPSIDVHPSICPPKSTITVVQADSAMHLGLAVCMGDGKGALVHLIRESTGGQCRCSSKSFASSVKHAPCVPSVIGYHMTL